MAPYEYCKEIRHPIGYGCVTPLLLQYSHAFGKNMPQNLTHQFQFTWGQWEG